MHNLVLCGLTADEIFNIIGPLGYSYHHALLISHSIYKKRLSQVSLFQKIPGTLKKWIESVYHTGLFLPIASECSVDKTIKYLFRSDDGSEYETVYMPDNKRHTVCISVQSGCRMGCRFCATGRYGFRGDLSAGEILNQILSIPEAGKITHVVFMGMGEPMDNLDNVLKACEILTAEWGLSISPRNITVSTVGLTAEVERFLKVSDCNLTVSLHSPFPEERKLIVPMETINPVQTIIDMMKNFPLKKRRRFSLAYVMIKDYNDTENHLLALKKIVGDSALRVNLIPYNPVQDDINTSSSDEKMQLFRHNLIISGISASIRKPRGTDISAACGLLAAGLK